MLDISPTPPIVSPTPIGSGGYNDATYNYGTYGTPRPISAIAAQDRLPSAYSLDNFGSILYAMTSADGRLLMWDPAGVSPGQVAAPATAPIVTTSPNVYIASASSLIVAGNTAYDLTISKTLGTVLSVAPDNHALSATGPFVVNATGIVVSTPIPVRVVPGMIVTDATLGLQLGKISTWAPVTGALAASGSFTASTSKILMSALNPGWVLPGMTVSDNTSSQPVGTVLSYLGTANGVVTAIGPWTTSTAKIPMNDVAPSWVVAGMTVYDNTTNQVIGTVKTYPTAPTVVVQTAAASFTTSSTTITMAGPAPSGLVAGMNVINTATGAVFIGIVASYVGNVLTLVAAALHASSTAADVLRFNDSTLTLNANAAFASSGAADALQISDIVLTLTANALHASSGATDSLQIGGNLLTLIAPVPFASAGSNDAILISGGSLVVLTANSAFAGATGDSIQFSGDVAVVQPPVSGRGPVPNGRCFVITNERFMMIFGAQNDGTIEGGKPSRFAWSDQENPGAWDYSNGVSQAGFLDIEPASPIVCANATRNGVIFFTAKKAYNSQFLGLPYIYNYVEIGNNCTPWSPQSISGTVSMTVWMSKQGLFAFDGTSITPMNCMVRPWVDDDIDLLEVREQACMVHVGDFSEVWWFFPQNGLTKNSRCIIYSYKEGWWGMGRMARTAGITSSYTAHTIMADDLIAYQHEVPNAYPIDVPLPWAETFDLNLNSGSKLTTLKQLMPDIDGDPTNLLYSVFYRNSRSAGDPELQTVPQQVRSNGYVDFRVTARDIRLRIEVGAPPGSAAAGRYAC